MRQSLFVEFRHLRQWQSVRRCVALTAFFATADPGDQIIRKKWENALRNRCVAALSNGVCSKGPEPDVLPRFWIS